MSLYCKFQKRLGDFLLDVDFEVGNEVLALMGASGCGKSMTLKCIAGIVKPDTGTIVLNDKTLFDSERHIHISPQKRNVGILFQDYALFPNMTVRQNISTGCLKLSPEKLDALIVQFHLSGLEKHYPYQLSGGQKQRCAIARMMAAAPDVILLDEPFSALDSFLRWQLEQEIAAEIKKFGGTTLLVSHNRDEVYRLSDRAAVMYQGKNQPPRRKQALYAFPKTYADALLTGCKNIYPAELQNNMIHVPSIGISFPNKNETKDPVDFVGIRARQIVPSFLCEKSKEYIHVNYVILSATENVFSYVLMILVQNASEPLRWEISKETFFALNQHAKMISIPLDKIILLRS